jgi:hypothetical protein
MSEHLDKLNRELYRNSQSLLSPIGESGKPHTKYDCWCQPHKKCPRCYKYNTHMWGTATLRDKMRCIDCGHNYEDVYYPCRDS